MRSSRFIRFGGLAWCLSSALLVAQTRQAIAQPARPPEAAPPSEAPPTQPAEPAPSETPTPDEPTPEQPTPEQPTPEQPKPPDSPAERPAPEESPASPPPPGPDAPPPSPAPERAPAARPSEDAPPGQADQTESTPTPAPEPTAPTEPPPETEEPPQVEPEPAQPFAPTATTQDEEPVAEVEVLAQTEALGDDAEFPEEQDVIVSGSRPERAAGSAHVLTRRQLERFRRDDPNAIVSQIPGVYIRQEDGVGLRPNIGIRGVNADRSKKITLMEDGVLFGPAPYSAPAAYYFPLMTRMVQVRAVKGPSAIHYGPQTVGGALDFVTRHIPSRPTGELHLGLGEYDYAKAHAHFGASSDEFGFLVEGVRLHDGGFKHLPFDADTGSTRDDWMVKAMYSPDPFADCRHRFSVKLSYADEVSNETYLGLSDEDFRADPDQRYPASALDQMNNHRTGVVFTHQYDADDAGIAIRTDAYRQNFNRSWRKLNGFRGATLRGVLSEPDDPANAEYYAVLSGEANGATAADALLIGPNQRAFVSQGVQSVLRWDAGGSLISHRPEFGLRFHNDSIERRHSETGYVMTDRLLFPEGSAEAVTTSNFAETHAVALYAADAMTWEDLTVTPGARVELIWSSLDDNLTDTKTKRDVQAVMPGVGAYYEILDGLGLLAGVHRGFSPPAPGADDQVRPEYSVNSEAGVRYSDSPLQAEVIGFYNAYQNLTDVCTLSSGCLAENLDQQLDVGEASIYGLEAYTSHEARLGQFTLPVMLGYTLTYARFDHSFSSSDPIYGEVEDGDEMPYVPRHQLSSSVGIENRVAGITSAVNYVSPMREETGSGSLDEALSTDEQFWIDVSAIYRPLERLSLRLDVRNVLDSRRLVARRPYGARPNAPRWIQVGASLKF